MRGKAREMTKLLGKLLSLGSADEDDLTQPLLAQWKMPEVVVVRNRKVT